MNEGRRKKRVRVRGRSGPFLDGDCSAHDSIVGTISGPETVPILGPAMRYPGGRYTPHDPLAGNRGCAENFGNTFWASKPVPEFRAMSGALGVKEVRLE